MILTCPKCDSRFVLPDQVLGEEGKRVKCSACGEVWFQKPQDTASEAVQESSQEKIPEETGEQDEGAGSFGAMLAKVQEETEGPEPEEMPEISEEINESSVVHEDEGIDDHMPEGEAGEHDSIPEGIIPGESPVSPDEESSSGENKGRKSGRIAGYLAAIVVFFLMGGGLLMLHDSVVNAWPASQSFYRWFGYEMAVPGQGLVFDSITAKIDTADSKGEKIVVRGKVLNLTSEPKDVPHIEASLRDDNGKIIAHWIIIPVANQLPAEGETEFSSTYVSRHKGGQDVRLGFRVDR